MSLFRYTFDRGVARDVVYKLDYNVLLRDHGEEYQGLFRDAGWEYVGQVASWHYFRTPAGEGADPDIFTDTESRVAKYKRLVWILVLLLPSQFVLIQNLLTRVLTASEGPLGTFMTTGALLYAAILSFWVYALIRLGLHIARLRRRGRDAA